MKLVPCKQSACCLASLDGLPHGLFARTARFLLALKCTCVKENAAHNQIYPFQNFTDYRWTLISSSRTPLFHTRFKNSSITVIQSTSAMMPPWDICLLTTLIKCPPSRPDWIILVFSINAIRHLSYVILSRLASPWGLCYWCYWILHIYPSRLLRYDAFNVTTAQSC